MKETGGGRYERGEEPIYFLAGSWFDTHARFHPYVLVAINDLADNETMLGRLDEVLERDTNVKVLLDSGIFWLTNRHMRAHSESITMDEALSLPPSEIDGFDWLWDNYVDIVRRYQDRLWGYIELDQGGAVNKRITRAKIEAKGLRPMPVYHPLNDGWDYFDELASSYDRICVGNVVQARPSIRRHLFATLWERRRRYPHLWIHLLGVTPNDVVAVYPQASCDSSAWVYAVRFGAENSPGAHSMSDVFGKFPSKFSYDRDMPRDGTAGVTRGVDFLASEAHFMQEATRAHHRDMCATFDTDLWPAYDEAERVRA